MTSCVYCGVKVDPHAGQHWQRVIGWERKSQGSSRRSGSDIACRERTEHFACLGCIEELKMGLTPGQRSLID